MGCADGGVPIGLREGQPIARQQFLSDVAGLAAYLPAQKYVLNLCSDRYRFMVGFAAALCREQVSLMPANDRPATLEALVDEYPGVYALTDAATPPLATIRYPESFGPAAEPGANPVIPATQLAAILFTSGSTGHPKPVAKTWGVLARSAQSAGNRLGIARFGGAAVVGTVPHQHSYGLESLILLALHHKLTVVAERPFFPADIQAAIEAAPSPRILVTTPVHLRALVAEPNGMPKVDLILSATAPLAAELAAKAEACLGAPLVEIYGASETGQIATRRTVREVQWRCLDDVHLECREGRSWVAGDAVPLPTALDDLIEHTGPDRFLLAGRSDDLVDIAGKHTTLSHLNDQLLSIVGVQDGLFAMPDPDHRRISRLAAIVVAPGLPASAILSALRQRIDAAFLPRPLILVDALPRNPLGKVPRELVSQLVQRSRGP